MQTNQHIPERVSYGTETKTAAQLRVGDKIVGNNNYLVIDKIRPGVAGIFYPILEMTDAYGRKSAVDTGSTGRKQDSVYIIEKVTPMKGPMPR